jgi:hypothetical protein
MFFKMRVTVEEMEWLKGQAGEVPVAQWVREMVGLDVKKRGRPVGQPRELDLVPNYKSTYVPPKGLCPRCTRMGKPACETCIRAHGRMS